MKIQQQPMLTVWRNGQEWFDFPPANEQNVQDMLIRQGVSAECTILPKGESPVMAPVTELKIKQPKQKAQ